MPAEDWRRAGRQCRAEQVRASVQLIHKGVLLLAWLVLNCVLLFFFYLLG